MYPMSNLPVLPPDTVNLYPQSLGLNAISGGRRTPANDQEKWTFEFDRFRV